MDYQMQKFIRNLTGRPQDDRPIFIISGAPGSGKNAYVRDNKQAGDLVFDMDAIAAALQGETTAHPICQYENENHFHIDKWGEYPYNMKTIFKLRMERPL